MTNILLIEPDRVLANIYNLSLTNQGYHVEHVFGAQDAVSSADETRPDLVILELQLVAHSGIEFLYEFRSYPDWQHIPVIILTHIPPMAINEDIATILRATLGMDFYLYKPSTSLRVLLKVVSASLADRGQK